MPGAQDAQNPPTFAHPMWATGAREETQSFAWCGWGMNIFRISLKRSADEDCYLQKCQRQFSDWSRADVHLAKPCCEGGLTALPRGPAPWGGSIPPYTLVTALVSAGVSLGKCLALPGSSGRMSFYTFYINCSDAWKSDETSGSWSPSLGRVQH